MRSSVLAAAFVALATWSCGGSSGNPSGPGPTAATIDILGERGAQSFTPNPASVTQGNMLVWRNTDTVVHRIVLNDGSLDTGDIAPGVSSPLLRLAANGANYHCSIHPTMVGTINRDTGEAPPCSGPYC